MALLVYLLLRYLSYLSKWSHSFTRLFTILRAILWAKLDLLKLLDCYGTAKGSFRNLARPDQAYFPGFLRNYGTADTPDEKVETNAGVESCENPKSRFEINRDIPSETERNRSNFSASGTALKTTLSMKLLVGRAVPCAPNTRIATCGGAHGVPRPTTSNRWMRRLRCSFPLFLC